MTSDKVKAYAMIGALAVGAVIAFMAYRRGVKLITEDLNIASEKNIVYSAFNTYDATGKQTSSLGSDIFDSTTHEDGTFRWPWEDRRKIGEPDQ